jgi:hypothetical protein
VWWIRRPPSTGLPATSCDNLRSPTPWTNVGEFKGRTWLSPPVTYPLTVGHEMHSPATIYPGTSSAYIMTTQFPLGPQPYGSTGKRLGRTQKHDEPPPQHTNSSTHEHDMRVKLLSQLSIYMMNHPLNTLV